MKYRIQPITLLFHATPFSTCRENGQWVFQKHGVFSVDRESTDRKAMEIAQDILKNKNTHSLFSLKVKSITVTISSPPFVKVQQH